MCTAQDTECGGQAGIGDIIPVTGIPGHLTTITITTDTILTGTTIITVITVTGIITAAGAIIITITAMYVFTVLL